MCEYQPSCSTKPVLITTAFVCRNLEKHRTFFYFYENYEENLRKRSRIIRRPPQAGKLKRRDFKLGDLLYEFQAETRLTVYRRLDIKQGNLCYDPLRQNSRSGVFVLPLRTLLSKGDALGILRRRCPGILWLYELLSQQGNLCSTSHYFQAGKPRPQNSSSRSIPNEE